jgi:N-acetylmuramoyl-L-alanine amidase
MKNLTVTRSPKRRLTLLGSTILLVVASVVAHGHSTAGGHTTAGSQTALSSRTRRKPGRISIGPREIREAEQRLFDLGYWTGPITGRMDVASHQALIAFQKVESRKVTGRLTMDELEALRDASPPVPRDKSYAHVEIDLGRQVFMFIDETGTVSRVLPVSSGSGKTFVSEGWEREAITPTGRFKVSTKIPGWHKSPMGMLYYPSYIVGGIAIHGAPSVPAFPASHGCIRVPMFAAKEVSAMLPPGTWVIVYGTPPLRESVASGGNK